MCSHFSIEKEEKHVWYTMLGEGSVTDWTCQKWFAKFPAGDFSLDDASQSGRPVEAESNQRH